MLGEQLGEPHTQRGIGVGGDIGVVGGAPGSLPTTKHCCVVDGRMGELERSASLKVDGAGDGGRDGRVELVACCGFAIP